MRIDHKKEIPIEVELKNVFVRLDPVESVECKRSLLESLLHLIQTQLIHERAKQLRREELLREAQIKRNIREMAEFYSKLFEQLPKPRYERKAKKPEKPAEKVEKPPEVKEVPAPVPAAPAVPAPVAAKPKRTREAMLEAELKAIRERLEKL